jgi:arsenical pump membrane protein
MSISRSRRLSAARSSTARRTSTARRAPALNWFLAALGRGTDVYLFLAGMMALAAYAQLAGIFDWIAVRAVRIAGTSRWRLFALVYVAGIVTTALLSNDATIVALTPAVISVLRRYDAAPLAYVIACALVANAASFVLPISNPSNLLVFAGRMPSLTAWLAMFALPSIAAIAITFVLACWAFRRDLAGHAVNGAENDVPVPAPLPVALLVAATIVIVVTSARGGPLGAAAFACGAIACIAAAVHRCGDLATIAREISWRIIALTAVLFVIVTALDDAGGFHAVRTVLAWCAGLAVPWPALTSGFVIALASNVINNLPVGLNLGQTLPGMHAPVQLSAAALIGVNLGPNATVNGSLATLLWLRIVRRANIAVPPFAFARIGLLATIPALAAALLLS